MTTLHRVEAAFLLPLVLLHALADRLDRFLFPPVATVAIAQPLAAAVVAAVAPPTDLSALGVVALRGLARARLGASTRIGGRRIAQATKAGLLAALAGG